jgi:tRNA/rRNA methyltransferase
MEVAWSLWIMNELQRCRVVLVQPHFAGNLGATARVMRNMGLSELVLVAPQANPADREARRQSTHGECVLERARVVDELADAVADCALIAATSARTGGLVRRQSVGPPAEIMPRLTQVLRQEASVALVFGPEHRGLTNEEVTRCHYVVHIPADPTYPALNLAQAVGICLYELRRAWFMMDPAHAGELPAPAPFAAQELMFSRLREALERIHFLYGPKADSLMHALRHLVGRAQPTEMEVEVLLGLARQINWFVEHGKKGES